VVILKTVFLSHLFLKTIFLPRQARDKHRETTQKGVAFSCRWKNFFLMAIGHMLLNATEAFLPDSEEEDEDERGSIRNEGREMSSASSGGGGRAGQQQGQAHTSEACKKAELMCRWAAAIPIYIYIYI
jgi:hypothetical protein